MLDYGKRHWTKKAMSFKPKKQNKTKAKCISNSRWMFIWCCGSLLYIGWEDIHTFHFLHSAIHISEFMHLVDYRLQVYLISLKRDFVEAQIVIHDFFWKYVLPFFFLNSSSSLTICSNFPSPSWSSYALLLHGLNLMILLAKLYLIFCTCMCWLFSIV